MTEFSSRDHLRKHMRDRRRRLSAPALAHCEQQLCRRLLALPEISRCRHIAGYWPNDGEISPLMALKRLNLEGKSIYLPKLTDDKRLVFGQWSGKRALRCNRFGIPEPVQRRYRSARELDVILMPLVAFDSSGNRLGMGGGYYDRSFAFRRHGWMKKPLLVGVAHDFQQVDALASESWDIPLDMIVTDRRTFNKR